MIFDLKEKEPVAIKCPLANNILYVSNGFQSSKKIKIKYKSGNSYFFQVNAVIDNAGLLTAIGISLLLFVGYIFSAVKLLLILANVPVLFLLYVFFINPKNSIVLKPWQPLPDKKSK